LKRALELLQLQQARFPESATHVEGEALIARVYAELAERGEADAAREITARATEEEIRQETRAAALQALMHMDPRKAMPVLKKIVLDRNSENQELRQHAIMIMCQQGDQEAEEILIKLLEDEKDTEIISHVVMCLSMSGSESSLQAIMKVFKETDDSAVSEAALMSIAQHSGDEVFDFLRDLAVDQKRPVDLRAHALMALGMTDRDEEVTDLLVDVLKSAEDREIQEMALFSLAQQGSPAAREAIVQVLETSHWGLDEEFQAMALHFAAQHGDIELDTLGQMYGRTENREMKQQILHVLTMMDDEEAALDLLIEITSNETDPEIKRDAVFWIGQFDSDRAADYLMKVINE
jgi:HEAT repeat protein